MRPRVVSPLKVKSVLVGGKAHSYIEYPTPVVEFETMAEAGWVRITSIGSENLYFMFKTDDQKEMQGFCKCL